MDDSRYELDERLQQASDLAEEGRLPEAFDVLREEEEDHPEDPMLLCMLGVVAGGMDDTRGIAYEYFLRALATEPTDPAVLVPLGAGLAEYDDPEAERVLRLAAVTAPHSFPARLQYGIYLASEGLIDAAEKELTAASGLDPNDPRAPAALGRARLRAGEMALGIEFLERAIELTPEDDPETELLYSLALLRVGRMEEAAEELYRVASFPELVPDGPVQLALSLAAATQEWWDQAWDALARAEAAEDSVEPALLREAEDALEGGPDLAASFLNDHVAPAVLRDRLALDR